MEHCRLHHGGRPQKISKELDRAVTLNQEALGIISNERVQQYRNSTEANIRSESLAMKLSIGTPSLSKFERETMKRWRSYQSLTDKDICYRIRFSAIPKIQQRFEGEIRKSWIQRLRKLF